MSEFATADPPGAGRPILVNASPNRQCWSDLGQSSQQDVSQGLGIAHAMEASDFDQLAPEDSL